MQSLDYFVSQERARETHFLQSLIVRWDCPPAIELSRRLAHARHEGRVLRQAILLVLLIGLLAASALAYTAILAPDLLELHPGKILAAEALGMGSLLSVAGFMAYIYWIDAVSNSLHEECRNYLLHRWRSRSGNPMPARVQASRRHEYMNREIPAPGVTEVVN